MARYVALLRGINVGGHKIIRMADLRDTIAGAGATDVVTYIQSGNVVLSHPSRSAAALTTQLERAIAKAAGFAVPVVVRTAAELAAVVTANPFPAADPVHLHVQFLAATLPATALAAVDPAGYGRERFALVGRELYLMLPDGIGNSKLAGAIGRVKPIAATATARNWRTVEKLIELSGPSRA